MGSPAALVRSVGSLSACLMLAAATAPPVTHAAAHDQLTQAIAATPGKYAFYNFGPGAPAPMLDAAGNSYEMIDGGRLMVLKSAAGKLSPHLLVDTHQGVQARCEQTPGARTRDGLLQAAETFTPMQAWQMLGRPRIAINANFFDVRRQSAGRWKQIGCTSPLGAYLDNTGDAGRANVAVTGSVPYAGKQALSNGDEIWTPLSTLIIPVQSVPYLITPKAPNDFEPASAEIARLMDNGTRFVAVSGIKLLAPGDSSQLNDIGPRAPRTALAYDRVNDQFYIFQGGNYTPDQMQDLFRGLGADTAVLLDGGGSSALVLRRDNGQAWAGATSPPSSCDTPEVLCDWDPRERGLPAWLGLD